jgi:transposase-like protein
VPYVKCPECEADCLVITFSSSKRRHSCPLCGASLQTKRPVPERTAALANVREAQARFKSSARLGDRPRSAGQS